jgi:hypothetical protein
MPKALLRCPGSVKVVVSSASAVGASNAPKAPWSAQAASSHSKLCAIPPSAETTAKPTAPATKDPSLASPFPELTAVEITPVERAG